MLSVLLTSVFLTLTLLQVFARPLAELGRYRCALREAVAAASCEPDGAHGQSTPPLV